MSTQDTDAPLSSFRDSHGGILKHLVRLNDLCQLVRQPGMEGAVEDSALAIWRFFREVIMAHHEEEEEELFSAVLRVKDLDPPTHDKVTAAIERLTREHRDVEAEWAAIEPQIRKLSRGKLSILDVDRVKTLVSKYEAHARYEEDEFLPLAETVLGRHSENLGRLGRSLHNRHSSKWVAGYV